MAILKSTMKGVSYLLAGVALSVAVFTEVYAQEKAPAVDLAAPKILKQMTEYLGGLKQFSVHTQNTLEDMVAGHRIDFELASDVVISRPNKLRAERKGDEIHQVFYYNGKTLTLHDPSQNVYATEAAPGTFDQLFVYLYQSLGLGIPASDLIYPNAYPLLMKDVTYAAVLGNSTIDGVRCTHLLFSRPGVDFQLWVAQGKQPLPRKLVVTDTATPELLSISTVMSRWNVAPGVADSRFNFVPPKSAKKIAFLPFAPGAGSGH